MFHTPAFVGAKPKATSAPSTDHASYEPGQIHTPFNWVVADATARNALVPTAEDVYKTCYQLDTATVYVLTSASPATWQSVVAQSIIFGPCFQATQDAGQSIAVGLNVVLAKNEVYDSHGLYDAPNGRFIADADGYYHFSGYITNTAGWTGNCQILLRRTRAGVTTNLWAGNHILAGNNTVMLGFAGDVQLLAGDIIEVTITLSVAQAGIGIRWAGHFIRPLINSGGISGGREMLTANRTYYVRTDGSDNNNGLTDNAAGAFLTLQKAADAIEKLDLNGYDVTVQVADGTYTTGVMLPNPVGKGTILFRGNPATPANCLINVTAANCFQASYPRQYAINGFKCQTTTSGRAIFADRFAYVTHSNMHFGACAGGHISSTQAKVVALTDFAISGGGTAHAIVSDGGSYDCIGRTVTLTGTPAWGIAFIYAVRVATAQFHGSTFTGAAAGQRYNVNHCSAIFVNGASSTFLPGSTAGFASANGVYA